MSRDYSIGSPFGAGLVADTEDKSYSIQSGYVMISAVAVSGIKVWTGTAWVMKPVKYWTGTAWVQKQIKRWTGTAWV